MKVYKHICSGCMPYELTDGTDPVFPPLGKKPPKYGADAARKAEDARIAEEWKRIHKRLKRELPTEQDAKRSSEELQRRLEALGERLQVHLSFT